MVQCGHLPAPPGSRCVCVCNCIRTCMLLRKETRKKNPARMLVGKSGD